MFHHGYNLTPHIHRRWPVPWAYHGFTRTKPAPRETGPSPKPPTAIPTPSRNSRSVRVVVETILPCSADAAFREVKTSRLLTDVCFPLVMFGRVDGHDFPDEWPAGESLDCRSYLLGMIPLGRRHLHFERIDDGAREIQSRESDPLVARWDHLIRITPLGPNRCLYRDEIVIEAGCRTGIVAWFAERLYRHRQKRWQAVARRLKAQEICSLARAA